MKCFCYCFRKIKAHFAAFWMVALLMMLAIVAQFSGFHSLLAWDREQIQAGQWWRIVTGNITHTNIAHLGMNLAGLVLIAWLHHRYYARYSALLLIWILMVAIGIALFFTPFDWYVGLSGVLHGLFVWGVVKDIQHNVPLAWLLLFGIVVKLVIDLVNNGDALTASLIEANVAYQAHWVGAVLGLLFALKYRKT